MLAPKIPFTVENLKRLGHLTNVKHVFAEDINNNIGGSCSVVGPDLRVLPERKIYNAIDKPQLFTASEATNWETSAVGEYVSLKGKNLIDVVTEQDTEFNGKTHSYRTTRYQVNTEQLIADFGVFPIQTKEMRTKSVIVKQGGGYCVNRVRFGLRRMGSLNKCGEVRTWRI